MLWFWTREEADPTMARSCHQTGRGRARQILAIRSPSATYPVGTPTPQRVVRTRASREGSDASSPCLY